MDKQIIGMIVESAKEAGFTVRSYSGRGMYRSRCVGIEFEKNSCDVVLDILQSYMDAYNIMQEERQDTLYEMMRVLKGAKEDSLGLGGIIYWPNMAWDEEFEDKDDCPSNCGSGCECNDCDRCRK